MRKEIDFERVWGVGAVDGGGVLRRRGTRTTAKGGDWSVDWARRSVAVRTLAPPREGRCLVVGGDDCTARVFRWTKRRRRKSDDDEDGKTKAAA